MTVGCPKLRSPIKADFGKAGDAEPYSSPEVKVSRWERDSIDLDWV